MSLTLDGAGWDGGGMRYHGMAWHGMAAWDTWMEHEWIRSSFIHLHSVTREEKSNSNFGLPYPLFLLSNHHFILIKIASPLLHQKEKSEIES